MKQILFSFFLVFIGGGLTFIGLQLTNHIDYNSFSGSVRNRDTVTAYIYDTVKGGHPDTVIAYRKPSLAEAQAELMKINPRELWTSQNEVGTVIMPRAWFHYFPDGSCRIDCDGLSTATQIKKDLTAAGIHFTCDVKPSGNFEQEYSLLQVFTYNRYYIPK